MAAILKVPVAKAKATVEVDADRIPSAYLEIVYIKGLSYLLGLGMSKITKETYPADADRFAAALAKANENLEAIYAGTLKVRGTSAGSTAKLPAAVKKMAMDEARRIIKDGIREAHKADPSRPKVSTVKASQITKLATDLLSSNPELIDWARAQVEAAASASKAIRVDLSSLTEDPTLAKKDAERRAKAKAPGLSAKQAAIPKKRQQQATAH